MKLAIVLAAAFAYATLLVFGHGPLMQDKESKTQPKQVTLDKDSQSDKWGEVAFNHENHATKNYSPDGTKPIGCTECHHTDQPAANLKTPLKTSERNVVLTADLLKTADAAAVKTCRACHLQVGDDSKPLPVVTYPDKPNPVKMSNDNAYHINCNTCHDAVIKAKPALKGKLGGSGPQDCALCHKQVG
ncbi:MAG: Class cytochrome family [Blastocatellia bacterium]|jgi:hypothetical protein|nr:Class cytochrome family [Blastocatellia bacterium]